MNRRHSLATVLVVLGVAILMVGALVSATVRDAALAAVAWCENAGLAGIAVYAVLYSLCSLLVLPAVILTVAAGWAWGLVGGTLIVLGVSLLADWIPFAIARGLGRERVRAASTHGHLLRVLDRAFRDHGFMLVALLRLSPVAPYNVTNYLLGLMPVSTLVYLAASTLGCIPGVLMNVYAGTLVPRSGDLADVGWYHDPSSLALGLGLGLVACLCIYLVARRALRQIASPLAEPAPEPIGQGPGEPTNIDYPESPRKTGRGTTAAPREYGEYPS